MSLVLSELKVEYWKASQCRALQATGHLNPIPREEVWAKRDLGVI